MQVVDASPWEVVTSPEPASEILALVTCIHFNDANGLDRFAVLVGEVIIQLTDTHGLVGWSMADSTDNTFLTLSAWESDQALREFVSARPHSQAMRELRRYSEVTTHSFATTASSIPLSWTDAVERLVRHR